MGPWVWSLPRGHFLEACRPHSAVDTSRPGATPQDQSQLGEETRWGPYEWNVGVRSEQSQEEPACASCW